MFKKILFVFASLFLFFPQAAKAGMQEDIKELFALMGFEKNVEESNRLVREMITKQLQKPVKCAYTGVTDAELAKIVGQAQKNFASTDDMEKFLTGLYTKFYTEQEVKDLIAFYKTPVGKKTIEIMPRIAQELAAYSMERTPAAVQGVVEEMEKLLSSKPQRPQNEAQACLAKN